MNLIYQHFLLFFTFLPLFSPVSPLSNDLNNLLSFKSTLLNPNTLQNWLITTNPCEFTGISCGKNSKITSIDLSFLPLSTNFTSVSTYLFSLEFITTLTLPNTNLSGTIQTISTCSSSLEQVDISHNNIDGSFINLATFKSCLSLSKINISFNKIDSKTLERNDLFSLSLESLDISGNLLSGQELLPLIISNSCEKLGFLSLKGNKLLGNFDLGGKCSNLEHFDISSNNFTTKLSAFGKSCGKLSYIDVSSNKFYGDLGEILLGCDNLSFLNVSNNVFDGKFPSLPTTRLEYVYLESNRFTGVIPETFVLSSCSNLLKFDVSFNSFVGMIPSSFRHCESMEVFDVSNNNFSGVLPIDVFTRMSSLKKLNLGFNKFEGSLPSDVSTIGKLDVLDLSSNNISGKIPSMICENSGLKELYLQNNMLIGEIPSSLGNCSELVSLDLSFNYLRGTIPSSLGDLPNLKDLIMWKNMLEGGIPFEVMNNKALENLILDNNRLSGTIPSGLRNCTNLNWISLSGNRLSGIIPSWIGSLNSLAILKLSSNSFHGPIPPELGDCKSLLWLDLNSNMLNGTIPSALAAQSGSMAVGLVVGKKYVYLRNAGGKECHGTGNLLEFSGIRSEALDSLSTGNCEFQQIYKGITQPTFNHNGSMIFLDLSYNNLEGGIPKELGKMAYLSILNLGHNNLSGSIPDEMEGLRSVGVLDLSYNSLSGLIPSALASLTFLSEIDLSNNKLSGQIPESSQLETFPAARFANNAGLCGYPLPPCDKSSGEDSSKRQKHGRRGSTLAGSIAMGLLFALFLIFGVIIAGIEVKKRRNKKDGVEDLYLDGNSNSYSCSNANTAWKYTSKHEALSISLATFDSKPLKKLTFADLLEATNGFHDDSMIGKGGFGDVYKARLKDGKVVAIKKLIHVGQGDREFMAEMETIGKIKHRNLVPLLGYCKVGDERLLVYEYMKYGSLEDVLHNRKKTGIKLKWSERRKIAIGAARGLAFLHHNCIPHIIHRDMKSSNVLLDENLEARVSDFGMARLMSAMDTHLSVSTLAGTPGYVPPEYYQSFRCSTKGDVYSYGVVLLELLTGRQPTDSVDFGDNNIVGWVKMHAKLKISDVFDPELIKEDPNLEVELLQHLKVAVSCVDDRVSKRPTIIEVMAMFKEIQAGSGLESGSIITTDDGSFGAMEVLTEVAEGNLK